MLRKYFVLLILVSACSLHAQIRHMYDSIRYDLKQNKTLVIGIDGKNSFIRDLKLQMYGAQLGYLYNKRTNIHLGFYTTFNKKKTIFDNPTAAQGSMDANTVLNKFGMAYFNLEGEYYFFNNHKWRFSIPAGVGIGMGWDKYYNNSQFTRKTNSFVIPVELGFNASYKLNWWVWLGAGLGTRVSFASGKYNGPFFTYGLQFQFEAIYERSKKLFEFL